MKEIRLFIRMDKGSGKYCVDDGAEGLNELTFESKGEAIGHTIDCWTNRGNI